MGATLLKVDNKGILRLADSIYAQSTLFQNTISSAQIASMQNWEDGRLVSDEELVGRDSELSGVDYCLVVTGLRVAEVHLLQPNGKCD